MGQVAGEGLARQHVEHLLRPARADGGGGGSLSGADERVDAAADGAQAVVHLPHVHLERGDAGAQRAGHLRERLVGLLEQPRVLRLPLVDLRE